MSTVDRVTLSRPDDWHLHLRDGEAMRSIAPFSARQFGRAIVMPNLRPPVTTVAQAMVYRDRILGALPEDSSFSPLMTLYLTEHTTPDEVVRAARCEHVAGIKLYPAGATTNSEAGVRSLEPVLDVLDAMQQFEVPLLVHAESTDASTDVFDREARFVEDTLAPLTERMPRLPIVVEHVTTTTAVDFVLAAHDRVAATITAHHLLLNRNAMFDRGFRPHAYCLPVAKREHHRQALLKAAASGNPKFFLGTDSAPHPREAKEAACGCAGIFTAHAAIELYAEAFDSVDALDRLEGFASQFGADFYRRARNADTVTLVRRDWMVPESYALGAGVVVPLRAGERVAWSLSG